MGSLVKSHLSGKLGVAPEKIYHMTVMPCFDKKLEASRETFKDDVTQVADVDLVITAVELEQVTNQYRKYDAYTCVTLLSKVNVSKQINVTVLFQMISESETPLSNFLASKLDALLTPTPSSNWLSNYGSGSGGFAENVFVAAAKEIFDQTISSPLEFRVVKNSDFQVLVQLKK